jgi:hypothetical protein
LAWVVDVDAGRWRVEVLVMVAEALLDWMPLGACWAAGPVGGLNAFGADGVGCGCADEEDEEEARPLRGPVGMIPGVEARCCGACDWACDVEGCEMDGAWRGGPPP